MQDQGLMQQILDNLTLVYLFTAFVGICVWVIFGKSKSYRDTANMIFRNEDKPATDTDASAPARREEAHT